MTPLILVALAGVAAPDPEPKPRLVKVGPNVVLEINGKQRRVIVTSSVVLRKGPLEGLLTRAKKKEHEYILAGDFDARHVHTALELAGAKAGKPVEFVPKYKPATGSMVRISLRYKKGGKEVTVPAGEWIKETKTGKAIKTDWVFGGSRFVDSADGKGGKDYVANHGDVVCLCNMDSAMLDIPVASPKAFSDRIHEAHEAKIPENGTAVEVIFEVVPAKKK
jgi:hypothetical protein